MPASTPLDALDLRLVRLVQADARRSLRSMADALGVSAPTCLRRLRRLEKSGVIRGYGARVDAARLGLSLLAYVEVSLVAPSGVEIRRFERRMLRCPEVVECAELAGDIDYMLVVRTGSMAEFSEFARRHLADDSSVRSYRSLLVMREAKKADDGGRSEAHAARPAVTPR